MRSKLRYLWIILLLIPCLTFAAEFQEGIDYQAIHVKPQRFPGTKILIDKIDTKPGQIAVIEFFSFGCPACYRFESVIENWLRTKPRDVKFVRIPVIFNTQWQIYAKAFYVAKQLNIENKMMPILFEAVQRQGLDFNRKGVMQKLFVEKGGVTPQQFNAAFDFAPVMAARVTQGNALLRLYRVYEIPTIVIDGKYKIDPGMTKGNTDRMIQVVNFLLNKIRKQKGLPAQNPNQQQLSLLLKRAPKQQHQILLS